MKIIISPAKTMQIAPQKLPVTAKPAYRKQTEILLKAAKQMSFSELQKMWHTGDKLTKENQERFAQMNLDQDLTAAILAYQGQVYRHIAVDRLKTAELDYLQKHLRILSGFYGIVKPLDGIVPYRLEMSNKIRVKEFDNLYDFWGDTLYQDLYADGDTIVNLASKEYSQVISKHLQSQDQLLTIEFVQEKQGKLRQLGMVSKMARGEMVRFMAEHKVEDPEQLQSFTYRNLSYSDKYSDGQNMRFIEKD